MFLSVLFHVAAALDHTAGPSVLPGRVAGVPALVQAERRGAEHGNFELVVPAADAGFLHYWRINADPQMRWEGPVAVGRELGRVEAVSLIESSFGSPRNLEVLVQAGGRLYALWRDTETLRWSAPALITDGVRGAPSLIQSRFGAPGNFEVVAPDADGGLVHLWRDNSEPGMPWSGPAPFAPELGVVSEVSLIQSRFGDGNLEVVARSGDTLWHLWRGAAPDWRWSKPQRVGGGAAGNPALLQSTFGETGNFEVLVPSTRGGLDLWFRDNDQPGYPWVGPLTTTGGAVDAVAFIQGSYGAPRHFEVVVRAGDRLDFGWREGQDRWSPRFPLTAPVAAPTFPGPTPSLRKAWTEWLGPLVTRPGTGGPGDLAGTGMYGTDLGASFEHRGDLVFLFGDTWTTGGPSGPRVGPDGHDADSMAISRASAVDRWELPDLAFLRRAPGGPFAPIEAGISHAGMEVPVEGVSLGDRICAFFVTGWEDPGAERARYAESVIACRPDARGTTFEIADRRPSERFLNVSLVNIDDWTYIFGAGNPYRHTPVWLARVPTRDLLQRDRWTYFRGTLDGRPVFGPGEVTAAALIETPCVGELSVRAYPSWGNLLMTYNCDAAADRRRGIHLRTAAAPWGPWSQPELLLDVDGLVDPAYGVVMHRHRNDGPDDGLSEPVHWAVKTDGDAWGGEYAPYIVPRWSRRAGPRHDLVWLLSTWHPYKVMVMRTSLVADPNVALVRRSYAGPLDPLDDPSFSQPGLPAWSATGARFLRFEAFGHPYVTTYDAAAGGDALTGTLSQSFRVQPGDRSLHFWVHGGHARVRLYVRGITVRETRGLDSNAAELEVRWDLTPFAGELVRLVIEDDDRGPWGFISVSGFEVEAAGP